MLEHASQRLLVSAGEAGEELAILIVVLGCPGHASPTTQLDGRGASSAHLSFAAVEVAVRAARAAAYERARPEILEHIPRTARRVLDLGCATGATGAALKRRQAATVTGVELEPEYAREARAVLDAVIEGDVEDVELDGSFDALIAADVLEHLRDPWGALRRHAARLEPGGTAVVSLPNVGHWSTYYNLARGTWPRRPEGIFDATHLRWFTLRDARALLLDAGLEPVAVVRRGWVLTRGSRLDAGVGPLLHVPGLRTLLTFQYVLAARRILRA
jgi:2-polyprenyl-3-methyl-5-hydroxy-6-metoxy-1,4-benzoquinol methylase